MQSYRQFRQIQASADSECQVLQEKPDELTSGEGHPMKCVTVKNKLESEREEGQTEIFVVGWDGPQDPLNPKNFSTVKRVFTTLMVALLAFTVGSASATDAAVVPQAAKEFGVSEVTESLSTGVYLAGYAFGSVLAAPFSETLGRNLIYICTTIIFGLFIMASGLAPNIGAQIVLRFLAGFFGSTPLVCAGGTIADLWDQMEKTFAFPLYAITSFGGAVMGPVIASYVAPGGKLDNWRWAEWLTLIMAGLTLTLVSMFMPETFGPLLLKWKAAELRKLTGDVRYKSELELGQATIMLRMKVALIRPFQMAAEPIIVLMALYLTVLYIVLFTFLTGFTFIFHDTYGISQGLTNICFVGLFIGMLLPSLLVYPVYKITQNDLKKVHATGRKSLDPEVRLWYAMIGGGSIVVPISLFWLGWTDYSSVSIWSPLLATVMFGYGAVCVFVTVYMYVIDAYEIYAASALTLVTFMRYLSAAGMTVVGIPFYRNMGTHYTLTIMACLSALLVPLPYVFYFKGAKIRQWSKHAAIKV
ncbi:major facilitator superfamily domain-containing protein [Lipomyces arxii]|uniref:major facilitator superfamily domain-containing protein n=1 Tax=Lipomyces arxii TaxID=56418 RepID=UPI0034CF780C